MISPQCLRMLGAFLVYGILYGVSPFFVFLGCHLDITSIRNVTAIDNVTDKCYVIAMCNVTYKCEECNEPMTGRIDRKFCSAACRQKSYRNSRNVTAINNVTAEPFELNTDNVFYRHSDAVRLAIHQLSEIQYLSQQEDDEGPVTAMAYPPRVKARADQDLKFGLMGLEEFLNGYDKIAENLARLRATAEAILKFHEAP